MARAVTHVPLHILTVHGIRTFGSWQTRLEHLIKSQMGSVTFSAYKFGYFTVPAFLLPPIRNRGVNKLAQHLSKLFEKTLERTIRNLLT